MIDRTDDQDVLDTCGLKCPLPVLKTRKALRSVTMGQTLTVLATDPLAHLDLQNFCQEAGHDLVNVAEETEGVQRFTIRRLK